MDKWLGNSNDIYEEHGDKTAVGQKIGGVGQFPLFDEF